MRDGSRKSMYFLYNCQSLLAQTCHISMDTHSSDNNSMQNLAVTNALVAGSNVFGLLPLLQANTTTQALIAITAVSASTLMHLSERKHDLPGIAPFSKWFIAFLWFDRMVALGAGGYVACKFARNMSAIPWELVLIGLPALALPEHVEGGPIWFATTHSAWHISAYLTMAIAFGLD